MNHESRKKLEKFLDEKTRVIYRETKNISGILDIHYVKTAKGFDNSRTDWGDDGSYDIDFFNGNNCQHLYYDYNSKGRKEKETISISIDNISSSRWCGSIGMLYRCMDEMNEIAEEFRKLKGELEKQEKIEELTKNSIYTWINTIMENQPYSYYIKESALKITLSVKLRYRTQLDIPIYYSDFQNIIPEVLETIQQFTENAEKIKIKALISNSKPYEQWKWAGGKNGSKH